MSAHSLPSVVHFKQAGVIVFIPTYSLQLMPISVNPPLRGPINFLDLSLVYVKFLFPINK